MTRGNLQWTKRTRGEERLEKDPVREARGNLHEFKFEDTQYHIKCGVWGGGGEGDTGIEEKHRKNFVYSQHY